ncbi:MAG: preprotein translocase subunit SecE [Candidatus Omnitrophica bacterium]|nr:preprotein translocase subunit SecE [Candidatus Omnitrophota bacterium]
MKKKIINFLQEVKTELEKVSWPEKKILKITTGVVVLFMLLFGFYLGVVDLVFSKIIRIFLR